MRTETRNAEANPYRPPMSLDRLLKRRGIGSKDSERLKRAFNLALNALYLVDRNDPICEIVAQKIIEIGLDHSRNPREIAAVTVKQLGP